MCKLWEQFSPSLQIHSCVPVHLHNGRCIQRMMIDFYFQGTTVIATSTQNAAQLIDRLSRLACEKERSILLASHLTATIKRCDPMTAPQPTPDDCKILSIKQLISSGQESAILPHPQFKVVSYITYQFKSGNYQSCL